MKPSELLVAAKALIADPKHWVQFRNAAGANNETVSSMSDQAVCFCSFGAVDQAAWRANDRKPITNYNIGTVGGVYYDAEKLLRKSSQDLRSVGPATLNDSTDHPTVMKMFERAIELAKRVEGTV